MISTSNSAGDQGFKFFKVDELENLMLDAGFAEVEVSWKRGGKRGG